MTEYHKIQSIFKRDMANKGKMIHGAWTLPEFEYLQNNDWLFTEKVDGTNIRIIWQNGELSFGGRTDTAQIPATLFQKLQRKFTQESVMDLLRSVFPDGAILYGEGYGAKIQKGGGNYRNDQDFVLFDVKVGKWWLSRENVEGIARTLGIDVVPVVGTGTLHDGIEIVRNGNISAWGNFVAEGIIATPLCPLSMRNGRRIITKIKHCDFKHECGAEGKR